MKQSPEELILCMKRLIGCESFETVFRKLFQSFLGRLECCLRYRLSWVCLSSIHEIVNKRLVSSVYLSNSSEKDVEMLIWVKYIFFGKWKILNFSFMATFPGCVNIFVQLYHFSRSNLLYLNFPCVCNIFLEVFYWFLFSLSFVKISRASAKSIFFFCRTFIFHVFSLCDVLRFFFLSPSTVSREQSFVRSVINKKTF